MIHKISSSVTKSGSAELVTKHFQRNLQQVQTKSGYINGRLYYREWIIREYKKAVKYFQSYQKNGIPFKNSMCKLDLNA